MGTASGTHAPKVDLSDLAEDEDATAPLVDAVVIGAGLAGLYMLYRLQKLGLSVRVYEAGQDVGGTWFWNRYPGARCDVPSMEYSYSFSSELEQEWEWSEKYPAQPEILRYIHHVADRFDLRRHVRLGTKVTRAAFDEGEQCWEVSTDRGETIRARFCITAVGCLSAANRPNIPGLDTFAGECYHTADWPEGGADLTGRRVGVIGTGSSGIQCIPVIADQASELIVFQRTPAFSLPAGNAPLDPDYQRRMKDRYSEFRQRARMSKGGVPVESPTQSALEVSSDERTRRYQAAWDEGNLPLMMASFTDLLTDPVANDTLAEFIRGKIRQLVDDPDVASALSPDDYAIGTKRPCLDSNYYVTYNREHVSLVDLRKTPIVAVVPSGVQTAAQTYELDTLVLATGFDALTGALNAIDIRGRDNLALSAKWAEGPKTYLGIAVAGFPNLFILTGPGSPSVLSNVVVSIEQHVEWVAACIDHLRTRGMATIEADPEAEDSWTQHTQELVALTLFSTTDSWYLGANVPGKPRVFMPYLGGVGGYREKCDEVAAAGYEGFILQPTVRPMAWVSPVPDPLAR